MTRASLLVLLGAAGVLALLAAVLPWASGGRVPLGVSGVLLASAVLMAGLGWLYRGTDACDAAPPALVRRYTRELAFGMGGYVMALMLSVWLLREAEGFGLRAAIALLPVAPFALALRAMVRYVRDADELQRRIELEAVSVATAFVSLLYLAGGLLQSARVIHLRAADAMIFVFPLVCFSYAVCKALVARRYR